MVNVVKLPGQTFRQLLNIREKRDAAEVELQQAEERVTEEIMRAFRSTTKEEVELNQLEFSDDGYAVINFESHDPNSRVGRIQNLIRTKHMTRSAAERVVDTAIAYDKPY